MRRRFRKQQESKTKFLDGPVIGRKTLKISGMHCEHCANTVTNALNGLDGITAKVNLKDNSAEVSYDREIDLADLKNAVKKQGMRSLLSHKSKTL